MIRLFNIKHPHVGFAFIVLLLAPIFAYAFELPSKTTARPTTSNGVPHVQLNIQTFPELTAQLLERVAKLPGVEVRDTVISLPGTKGFNMANNIRLARPDVIVGGREFAHVHPDGSLHAALEPNTARKAIEEGWAIAHPWAKRRPGWEGFVMIYTPQSQSELDVVYALVVDSYNFVTNNKTMIQ